MSPSHVTHAHRKFTPLPDEDIAQRYVPAVGHENPSTKLFGLHPRNFNALPYFDNRTAFDRKQAQWYGRLFMIEMPPASRAPI